MNNKKLATSIFLIIVCLFTARSVVFGTTEITDLSSSLKRAGDPINETLDGGVLYTRETLSSLQNLMQPNYWTNRDVFSYTLDGANEATNIATWSYSSLHEVSCVTLATIAKDYEEKHPGWIVVGGVNAEGFYSSNGSTNITNAFVQDGDVIRKDVSAESFKELIGFNKDRTHVVKRNPELSSTMTMDIYDADKNILNTLPISGINCLPLENQVTLITTDIHQELDLTGCDTYLGRYSMMRASTAFPDGLLSGKNGMFLKGKVTEKISDTSIKYCQLGNFYLVSKGVDISTLLTDGFTLRCEYKLEGAFKDVQSMTGYMFKLVENGATVTPSYRQTWTDEDIYYPQDGHTATGVDTSFTYSEHGYYSTQAKERSGIGFKEDGSIVLMTANTNTGGPNQYEFGEMFRTKGCTSAYQFDGGGSVTFLKRNIYGEFEMENIAGDNHPRSISTGIFFVTRDPGVFLKNTTRFSTTVSLKAVDGISNMVCHIDGKEIPVKDGMVIEGLQEGSTYSAYFTYDTIDALGKNKTVNTTSRKYVIQTKSLEQIPISISVANISKHSMSFSLVDSENQFRNVIIHLGDATYEMGEGKVLELKELIEATTYDVYYTYDVLDPVTSNWYTFDSNVIKVSTLSFELPLVDTFEFYEKMDTSCVIKYQFVDTDNKVTKAYITCDGVNYILDGKRGKQEITDLVRTTKSYTFTLVLEYTNDASVKEKVVSSEITLEKLEDTTPITPTPEKKGCKKSLSSEIILSLGSFSLCIYILRRKHE